jgi:hypothetical protein
MPIIFHPDNLNTRCSSAWRLIYGKAVRHSSNFDAPLTRSGVRPICVVNGSRAARVAGHWVVASSGPVHATARACRPVCCSTPPLHETMREKGVGTIRWSACSNASKAADGAATAEYIWPSGQPGTPRPGNGLGTARNFSGRHGTSCLLAVSVRASCLVFGPSMGLRADFRVMSA